MSARNPVDRTPAQDALLRAVEELCAAVWRDGAQAGDRYAARIACTIVKDWGEVEGVISPPLEQRDEWVRMLDELDRVVAEAEARGENRAREQDRVGREVSHTAFVRAMRREAEANAAFDAAAQMRHGETLICPEGISDRDRETAERLAKHCGPGF